MNTLDSLPKSRIFIPLFVPFPAAHPGIFAHSAPISGDRSFASTRYCLTPTTLSPEIDNTRVIAQPNHTPHTYTLLLSASSVSILRNNNPIFPDFTAEPAISYYFSPTSLSLNPTGKLTINKSTRPTGTPCYWFDRVALKTSSTMTDKMTNPLAPAIHTTIFHPIILNYRSVLSGVDNPDTWGNPFKKQQLIRF